MAASRGEITSSPGFPATAAARMAGTLSTVLEPVNAARLTLWSGRVQARRSGRATKTVVESGPSVLAAHPGGRLLSRRLPPCTVFHRRAAASLPKILARPHRGLACRSERRSARPPRSRRRRVPLSVLGQLDVGEAGGPRVSPCRERHHHPLAPIPLFRTRTLAPLSGFRLPVSTPGGHSHRLASPDHDPSGSLSIRLRHAGRTCGAHDCVCRLGRPDSSRNWRSEEHTSELQSRFDLV